MIYASLERKVADRTKELARANRRLAQPSVTDALTGLANRRRFEEVLTIEWERGVRSGAPVALLMLDIDRFKPYNDQYGHVAGDRCLQRVAALLSRHLRDVDLAARFGGDEFAVVMPGTGLDTALKTAERLREAVEVRDGSGRDGRQPVTVSVGVATTTPTAGTDAGMLTERADGALYGAKRAGGDRVHAAPARHNSLPDAHDGVN